MNLSNTEVRQRRFIAFERAVEIPMLLLALLMVPLLLIPEFFDLSPALKNALRVGEWFIWAAFAFELGVKTYLSERRRKYLIDHWYDVIIVVVPFLRPLRLVRSLRFLRATRGLRLLSSGMRLLENSRTTVTQYGLHYAALVGTMLFFVLTGLALIFEQGTPGSNIQTFGDAMWWGVVTAATVGYGDRFPVTTEGRVISVGLMLLGISLFSLVTASVAATFARPVADKQEATLEDVLQRLEQMEARLLSVQRSQTTLIEDVSEVEETVRTDTERP